MRTLFFLLSLLLTMPSHGQGQIGQVLFGNHVPPRVDAPVTLDPPPAQGYPGPGPEYSAQLLLVGASGSLSPLLPTSFFYRPGGTTGIASQYWIPETVAVPGTSPGETATFVVRGWLTSAGSYDTALSRGQSTPFSIVLGDESSPATLTTLQPFTISPAPEPSVLLLAGIGAAVLCFSRALSPRRRVRQPPDSALARGEAPSVAKPHGATE